MSPETDDTDPAAPAPLRPASPVRRQARNAALAGVSLVWLVPLLALVVTLGLAWNAYTGRGALVSVAFEDATGVTPGETVVKFREIAVGKVEGVRFTEDLRQVILDMRLDEDVAQYVDAEAQFWIVRPQVSAAGVSRLDTVLTGAFVEGDWDASPAAPRPEVLAGLEKPPLVRRGQRGTWITLASDDAEGISNGAPVMYRGVPVGRMENLRLSDKDEGVLADVFVEAPHDARLTTSTVFWDTSGLSVSLGAGGLALNVNSLASLLQGGVQFETLTSGGAPVEAGHVFRLQPDEDAARAALFSDEAGNELRLTMLVDTSVRGLAKGADVQYQGLQVGRVADLKVRVADASGTAPRQVQQELTLALSPMRLGLPEGTTAAAALDYLAGQVRQGLRARVASAGFLGTSLMVELVPVPDAPAAEIDLAAKPWPIIPSVEGELQDLTTTAQSFIGKIGALPLDETLRSFQNAANSITALASSEATRAIPADLRDAIAEAKAAATALSEITRGLRDGGAVDAANATLAQAKTLSERLAAASEKLPALIDKLDAIGAKAEAVDLAGLAARASEAVTALRDLVGSEAAQALPAQIGAAADAVKGPAAEIGAMAGELRASGAAGKLAAALDEAAAAAASLKTAAEGAPEMVAKIDEAAGRIGAADFAAVTSEAQGLVADLRAMLGTEDAAQLPRNLSETLKSASGLLTDLREGGAVGNLNSALGSAKTAGDEIASAARRLPQMTARFEQLAARAEAVIAAYGDRSAFNTEALGMMRELRRATAAFGSLAATIERNPRAFILGR